MMKYVIIKFLLLLICVVLRSADDEGQGRPPSAGTASGRPISVSAVGGEQEEREDPFPDQLEASLCEQRGGLSGGSAAALGTPR